MWSISYTHLSNKNGKIKDWKGDTFHDKQERTFFFVWGMCVFTAQVCLRQKEHIGYLSGPSKHLILQTFVQPNGTSPQITVLPPVSWVSMIRVHTFSNCHLAIVLLFWVIYFIWKLFSDMSCANLPPHMSPSIRLQPGTPPPTSIFLGNWKFGLWSTESLLCHWPAERLWSSFFTSFSPSFIFLVNWMPFLCPAAFLKICLSME